MKTIKLFFSIAVMSALIAGCDSDTSDLIPKSDNNSDNDKEVVKHSDGTLQNPYSIEEAIQKCDATKDSILSSVYIKGVVYQVSYYDSYGFSFYIIDKYDMKPKYHSWQNKYELYLDKMKWSEYKFLPPGRDLINEKDTVVACVSIDRKNYGVTSATNTGFIVSINSKSALPENNSIDFSISNDSKPVLLKMMEVSSGSFSMGSSKSDEAPSHLVRHSSTYYIGETAITQGVWRTVMGFIPPACNILDDNFPVYGISYNDCVTFVNKLNEMTAKDRPTGKKFHIPTEAEWEFAARGGNKTKGYEYAGTNNREAIRTSSDDTKTALPNELAIYGMSGNIKEWCYDWYGSYPSESQTDPQGPTSGTYKVLRGIGVVTIRAYADPTSTEVIFHTTTKSNAKIGLRIAL